MSQGITILLFILCKFLFVLLVKCKNSDLRIRIAAVLLSFAEVPEFLLVNFQALVHSENFIPQEILICCEIMSNVLTLLLVPSITVGYPKLAPTQK